MLEGVLYTGIPSEDELEHCPGVPGAERLKKGAVAVIECVQEIPCNPCEVACPFGAIKVGSPITNLPVLDLEKCTGCGSCIALCPGLAIFVVDVNHSDDKAAISFPYEYRPLPSEGDEVDAVNRQGEVVCKATVVRVRSPKAYNHTCVMTLAVPKAFANEVRSMRLLNQRPQVDPDTPPELIDSDDIICRCQEITMSQVVKAIEEGATTVDGVKKRTRTGMGLCQGKSCERLVQRIIAQQTGQDPADVIPATYRPPVRPIKMGTIEGEANEE